MRGALGPGSVILGTNISSNNITDGTIINADINSSAAIDSDKINFINNTVDVFNGTFEGDDNGEMLMGTSCGSNGDCASITKDKIELNNFNISDYSVEMIASCTDGAEYSCSTLLDDRPVIRFYDEAHNNNSLMGLSGFNNSFVIEDGSGSRSDLIIGDINTYEVAARGVTAGNNTANTFLEFKNTSAGVPASADCDDDSERGRMSIDTTNNRLYICNGATRGWDYVTLTD